MPSSPPPPPPLHFPHFFPYWASDSKARTRNNIGGRLSLGFFSEVTRLQVCLTAYSLHIRYWQNEQIPRRCKGAVLKIKFAGCLLRANQGMNEVSVFEIWKTLFKGLRISFSNQNLYWSHCLQTTSFFKNAPQAEPIFLFRIFASQFPICSY